MPGGTGSARCCRRRSPRWPPSEGPLNRPRRARVDSDRRALVLGCAAREGVSAAERASTIRHGYGGAKDGFRPGTVGSAGKGRAAGRPRPSAQHTPTVPASVPCALDTGCELNLPLYKRLGFLVVEGRAVLGSKLRTWAAGPGLSRQDQIPAVIDGLRVKLSNTAQAPSRASIAAAACWCRTGTRWL